MTPRELAASHRSKIIARRWLGMMIDVGLIFLLCAVIGVLVPARNGLVEGLLLFGIPFLYYVSMEGVFGRTVGKFALGMIVIDDRGAVPALGPIVIRTLTRYVEANPILLGGIPAGLVADRSAARQRLGDMLAGTYVVFTSELPKLREPEPYEG